MPICAYCGSPKNGKKPPGRREAPVPMLKQVDLHKTLAELRKALRGAEFALDLYRRTAGSPEGQVAVSAATVALRKAKEGYMKAMGCLPTAR